MSELMSLNCPELAESARDPLRVALLLDSYFVPLWVTNLVCNLRCCRFVDLVVIFCADTGPEPAARAPAQDSLLYRLWRRTDRVLSHNYRDALLHEDVRPYLPGIKVVHAANGPVQVPIDVIVNLATARDVSGILQIARFGVVEFEGDRGPGTRLDCSHFWAMHSGQRVISTGLRIRSCGSQLWRRVTGAQVLVDHASLSVSESRAYWKSSELLATSLQHIFLSGWHSLEADSIPIAGTTDHNDRPPGNTIMASFIPRWAVEYLRHTIPRLLVTYRWFIAVRSRNGLPGSSNFRFSIIRPPAGENYSDPFLFEKDGTTYLFFEKWTDTNFRGVLCCATLDERGNAGKPKVVLARSYHLSYPQVFESNGEIYLLPEAHKSGTVELYRAVEFPVRWERAAVLLKETVADPTLLEYNGSFWLFASGRGKQGDFNGELSLFFADSLFGPWQAHAKNPIVCDPRRARPAGSLFVQDGQLIRPAQDCCPRYGYAVCLNRVDVLSKTDYDETPVARITPDWLPGNVGTHTFNQTSKWCVVDGRARTLRRHFGRPLR